MKTEMRYTGNPVELPEGEQKRARGYAAVFYNGEARTQFEMELDNGKKVVERIMPGAFDEVMKRSTSLMSTFNHNPNNLLGTTAAGTLRSGIDSTGLWYEVDLPDTQAGNDVRTLIARGDIKGSSIWFRMTETGQAKRVEGGNLIREIRSIHQLVELGPVTDAAYSGTSTELRSNAEADLEAIEAEQQAEEQKQKDVDYANAAVAIVEKYV